MKPTSRSTEQGKKSNRLLSKERINPDTHPHKHVKMRTRRKREAAEVLRDELPLNERHRSALACRSVSFLRTCVSPHGFAFVFHVWPHNSCTCQDVETGKGVRLTLLVQSATVITVITAKKKEAAGAFAADVPSSCASP